MITYSIIKKSQLEGAKRLDAEYYQPEYLELDEKLKNAKNVAELTSNIRYGLYVEPDYLSDGINFVRAMNTTNFWIDGEILKISEKKVPSEYFLKTGDCLIVRSGANTGLVSVVYPRLEKSTFGSYTIRLRFNKINPFFAAVFLNSRYGLLQTQKLQTGMAQPNLNIPSIKEIKIPVVPGERQKEIEKICLEIEKTKSESGNFYSQAENLLLEELGLKNFESEIKKELWSVVNLSEAKKASRIDADYFDPKYVRLQKILKNAKSLSEIAERITKRLEINPKDEYNYIEISDVNAGNGEISSNKIRGEDLPANAKIKVSGGELIVSKVRPTRGAVAIIPDNWNKNFILSGAFSMFKIESPMRECLQVLLRSFVGKLQLEKPTTGTSYPTVTDKDVENILVPNLSKPTQQKTAELVRKSHEARKKSKELLETAKRKVEEMIEGKG